MFLKLFIISVWANGGSSTQFSDMLIAKENQILIANLPAIITLFTII